MRVNVSIGLHLLLYHSQNLLELFQRTVLGAARWNGGGDNAGLCRENRLEHATCGGKGVPLL